LFRAICPDEIVSPSFLQFLATFIFLLDGQASQVYSVDKMQP